MPDLARIALAIVLSSSVACSLPGWSTDDHPPDDREAQEQALGMIAPRDLGSRGKPAGPLERAPEKLRYVPKDARHLGFNLRTLSKTYALEGAVEIPEWSDPGEGDPRLARDDDLHTAWTCTPTRDTTCAYGIHFPEAATVTAVRLWAAARPGENADAPARVKTVRVHTDEGYGDVTWSDERDFAYAVLGRAVTTHQLTVEIRDWYDGKKSDRLALAELEIFGESGPPRPPLDLDPATVVVTGPASPWRKVAMEHKLEHAFIETVARDGTLRAIGPGTTLFGVPGDRVLLVEHIVHTGCTVHRGRYFAIDRKSRAWLPLGDLGGIPGDVYRHDKGEGFAVGIASDRTTRMQGLFIEDGIFERRKTHRAERTTAQEYFGEWGVSGDALPRGGQPLDQACDAATADSIAPLQRARPGKATAPDRWRVCDLGQDHALFVTANAPCGSAWEMVVVDPDAKVVAQRKGQATGGAALFVRASAASDPPAVFVEIGEREAARAFVVRRDGVLELETSGLAALAVRPPASCRTRCDSAFAHAAGPPK